MDALEHATLPIFSSKITETKYLLPRDTKICPFPRIILASPSKTLSPKDSQSCTPVVKPQRPSLQLENGKAHHKTFKEGNDLPAC